MILRDRYPGKNTLFVGDRTLVLQSIPAGASILSARITVTPVNVEGQKGPSEDSISFAEGSDVGRVNGQQDRFATKTQVPDRWVEVDFHGRRTLVSVDVNQRLDTILQVDIGGGTFIEINRNGAFKAPEDSDLFVIPGPSPTPDDPDIISASLPGLTVAGFKLTNSTDDDPPNNPDITEITIRNVASNVSLRLGELPPFWIHLGEMIESATTPDFTELLQSVLADAKRVNGFYVVPLILHTDSPARFNIETEIEYQRQVNVLPQGLNEVVMTYDFNGPPKADADLLKVLVPANARVIPGKTGGRVIGAFEESRIIHGPVGDVVSDVSIEISPGVAQARIATLENALTASAVDFLIAPVDELVQLQLDFREDLDGKPGNHSLLQAPIEFGLDRKKASGPTWVSVTLPQGFRFEERVGSRRLWIIVQSLNGRAEWRANPLSDEEIGMQHSRDGGLSWRETRLAGKGVNALFRLRHTPDRFQVPIQLQVGSGEQARTVLLDRFQPMGRVDFALDFPEVAEAFNEYLDANIKKRCPEAEHLVNGDFASGTLQPDEWELTAGEVALVRQEDFPQSYIKLGNLQSSEPTGLSQISPMMGGCQYLFEFTGSAIGAEGAEAFAEIIWLSENCGVIRIDQIAFPPRRSPVGGVAISSNERLLSVNQIDKFIPRNANLVAPIDAVQAEIRFLISEGGEALVDQVSLKATIEGVINADLRDIRSGAPEGWSVSPPDLEDPVSIRFEQEKPAIVITNPAENDESLVFSQHVPVSPGRPFIFEFAGRVDAVGQVFPDVLLRWKKVDGTSLPTIHVGPILPASPDRHFLEGKVPMDISELEIQIHLPPGASLLIEGVSFRQDEMIEVPLNFISYAPGELTVSGLQVAYDFVDPLPPSIPESGLCFATPPGKEPGEICDDKCFCSVCKRRQPIIKVNLAQTSSARPATVGECRACGSRLVRLGGPHDALAPKIATPTPKSARVALPGMPNSSSVSSESPNASTAAAKSAPLIQSKQLSLTDIKGIGESRARMLSQHGVHTLLQLVTADWQTLAKILGISEDRVAQIINRAQQLLAINATDHNDDSTR